jgi:transcriptional regulator with GAF, ATPase, and Fis domain
VSAPPAAAPVVINGHGEVATLEQIERDHFISVLRKTRGIIEGPNGAARLLNLKPSTTRFRIKKLNISKNDYLS